MLCPSCQKAPLKPALLEEALPSRECPGCHGVLVDLLAYRAWKESADQQHAPDSTVEEVSDNSKALVCPKCARVMLKFRISGAKANAIDVCTSCDDAWLDDGEWRLLGALALQDKLTTIFTDPWQRKVRQERAAEEKRTRLQELLGDEEFAKAERVAEWLAGHPQKEVLRRMLLIGD